MIWATFVLPYPHEEARIKEGANGRKDKTGKRWEFSFLLGKSSSVLYRVDKAPNIHVLGFSYTFTLVQCSHYYLTIAITSFLSFVIVRSVYCYCALEVTLSTKHKYKQLSDLKRKRKRQNSALDCYDGNRCENSKRWQ